jgi:hypothetical protein
MRIARYTSTSKWGTKWKTRNIRPVFFRYGGYNNAISHRKHNLPYRNLTFICCTVSLVMRVSWLKIMRPIRFTGNATIKIKTIFGLRLHCTLSSHTNSQTERRVQTSCQSAQAFVPNWFYGINWNVTTNLALFPYWSGTGLCLISKTLKTCVISGFRRSVNEVCAFPKFREIYRPLLQRSSSLGQSLKTYSHSNFKNVHHTKETCSHHPPPAKKFLKIKKTNFQIFR